MKSHGSLFVTVLDKCWICFLRPKTGYEIESIVGESELVPIYFPEVFPVLLFFDGT